MKFHRFSFFNFVYSLIAAVHEILKTVLEECSKNFTEADCRYLSELKDTCTEDMLRRSI